MFQPVSLFIGLRYSKSRNRSGFVSFITFFSIIGILLGVASLITVTSVMNGFENELKKRILGLVPHVVVAAQNSNTMDNWQQQQQLLLQQPHVVQVTPIIESEALIQSASSIHMVKMQGIKPQLEKHNIVASNMYSGELGMLTAEQYGVVIGQSLARKLNVIPGDQLRLLLPNKTVFTPMGRVPMQRTFTLVGTFNIGSQVDDQLVYLNSDNAAKMLRRKGDGISQLRIYLDDAFNLEQFLTYAAPTLNNLDVSTWKESQGALFAAVGMEKNMMALSLLLIIAVAAFNIVSALVLVVMDKRGEIGIMQTFGMTRGNIIKIFISQGMYNGLWGVSLGIVIGLILTFNLNNIISLLGINILGGTVTQELPILLAQGQVATIAIGALAMSFIATLYPAYRASTTQPAEVLRHE